MSQTQIQLVGNVRTGAVFAGIVTATSVNVADVVGINSDGINVTGVITATSFSGDLTGNANSATYSSAAGVSTALLGGTAGINTTSAPTKLYVQGNAAGNVVGLGSTSGTVTLDFTQGNSFSMTLTAATTLANPTGVTTGQSGVLLIQEDGTGGYAVAWGSSWDFASSTAPTLDTTANALNALPYFARSTTSIVVGSVISGIGTL
jgi:hypothetical protein